MTILGKNKALWKKKNTRYKKLMADFITKIILLLNLKFYWFIIKNCKNTFFLMLKKFKLIKFKFLIILDKTFFTKIKLKKKASLKRRITRKLTYLNPLKT